MRKLVQLVLVLGFIIVGWVSQSLAVSTDLRVGTFKGTWCNYPATFFVERQEGGGNWVFHGRILINQTQQYDPLWIEQYGDNSLRMIRSLSGPRAGQTQVVQTHGPELFRSPSGQISVSFTSKTSFGYGCEGTSSELIMEGQ